MKQPTLIPREPAREADKSEKDLRKILRSSDEKIKDLFDRHDAHRRTSAPSTEEDRRVG
jgi:predicted subunit of tRNA(5-methylaminomethyl-2-thiouridylate) methyltransferase